MRAFIRGAYRTLAESWKPEIGLDPIAQEAGNIADFPVG
jgi:hypothetical protein